MCLSASPSDYFSELATDPPVASLSLQMLRALVAVSVLALIGCATQRYEWSLAHQHLSPKMQKMPQADIREITRLVSQLSVAPIVCMSYTGSKSPYPDEVWVVAADSTTMEDSSNGLFRLKKRNGAWHIIDYGFDLSTSLIICSDG